MRTPVRGGIRRRRIVVVKRSEFQCRMVGVMYLVQLDDEAKVSACVGEAACEKELELLLSTKLRSLVFGSVVFVQWRACLYGLRTGRQEEFSETQLEAGALYLGACWSRH